MTQAIQSTKGSRTPNRNRALITTNTSPVSEQAARLLTASKLIEHGAKISLVMRLTHLERNTANRLYHEIHGAHSPCGLSCYNGNWFQRSTEHMLEASFVWLIYKKLLLAELSEPERLIMIRRLQLQYFRKPGLDFNHVADVVRLMAADIWLFRQCDACGTWHLAKKGAVRATCPGCKIITRHFCVDCGKVMDDTSLHTRKRRCIECREKTNAVSTRE